MKLVMLPLFLIAGLLATFALASVVEGMMPGSVWNKEVQASDRIAEAIGEAERRWAGNPPSEAYDVMRHLESLGHHDLSYYWPSGWPDGRISAIHAGRLADEWDFEVAGFPSVQACQMTAQQLRREQLRLAEAPFCDGRPPHRMTVRIFGFGQLAQGAASR